MKVARRMKRQSVTTAVKVTGTAREVYEEEASIRRAKVEALKDSKRKNLKKKKRTGRIRSNLSHFIFSSGNPS